MILYFTGTGNSRYVAEGIKSVTNDEIVSINEIMKNNHSKEFSSDEPFIFICPIYAWRIPRVVSDFIENSSFNGSNKVYFLVTCASREGASKSYIEKTLKKVNLELYGFSVIIMPENYIALYESPDTTTSNKIVENATFKIKQIAIKIKNQESFSKETNLMGHFLSTCINPIFYRFFVSLKGFHTNSNCNNCGNCVKNCPLNSISLIGNKPNWNGNCTHCMRCICACPREAIEYKNNTQNKSRYYLKKHFTENLK